METYGYFENGELFARTFEPQRTLVNDSNGNPIPQEVSVAEQVAALSSSQAWKPIDRIDDSRLTPTEPNTVIVPVPYDNGDRISYRYESRFDCQAVRGAIADLQASLSASDYKIIKCYEASLTGDTLPYDIYDLRSQRQGQRAAINDLQALLDKHAKK